MKVECPNCKMVSVIKTGRIITDQHALELSCPACDFAMALKLNSSPELQNHTRHPAERSGILQPAPDSEQIDAASQHRVMALKAKILRSLVNLPPMPHIILKAREILSDPESSLKDLAKVIETDQAMVAKILTLANSAYYGVSGMISSIPHASVLLGQRTLGQMITITASSALLSKRLRGYETEPEEMWKHSLACAFAAKRIAGLSNEEMVEDAFTAGLLHDAGKIILDPYVFNNKKEFKQFDSQKRRPLFETEKAIIGFDHAEIMSRACRLWRFPEIQVSAIRYHHQPSCSEENKLACMIHLADVLAKFAGFSAGRPTDLNQIAPGILGLLNIQQQDLNDLATAVADDVRKIEEELQE
jgi:HD-like signal output (HDOD) protein